MKITLVNPPVKKVVEIWDKPDYPQISIGYLAAFLEQKKVPVKVIDAKLEALTGPQVVRQCKGDDIVGISSLTHEITLSAKLAQKIKQASPKTKIVIGGAHATALPKETLEDFPDFDFLVYGEGEETLFELTQALKENKGFKGINGLVFRENGEVVVNSPRQGIQDLNTLPPPAWHLFPKAKEYPIITARGCPFNCIFCMRAHGQKVRARSVDDVVKELKMLADDFDAKYVYVYDETFTLFKDRTFKICDKMIKLGLHKKFTWEAETRVNLVDLEMLKKMKKAGCILIKYGVEAGNPEILKQSKKGIKIEEVEKAVALAKKAKMPTQGLFIIGHPNETKATMKDTIDLAVRLNTTTVAFGIMTPYPGTEIYNLAKEGKGGYKVLSSNWRDYNKQLGNALELENVSRKEMEKIQFWGYMKFYFYNFKIKEIFKNILINRKLAFAMIKKIFSS